MNNFYLRSWWVPALRGLFAILFGVLALVWPGLSLLTFIGLFAAWALFSGIASVAGAVRHRKVDDDWWLPLLLGLVSIGAAVVALVNPFLTMLVLVMVIGANALVTGVLDIVASVRLRKEIKGELLLGLAGLASIAFGAIVFLFPLAGALALVWLVSLYAIVSGALLLLLAIRGRALSTKAKAGVAPPVERRVMGDRRISPAH